MKLNINNITKSYRDNVALENINIDFNHGIYAILGPNGSGKTTLLNIITRNILPDSGYITYAEGDDEVNVEANEKKYFCKLGYMPQNPGLYLHFTSIDYLRYIANIKGISNIDYEVNHALNIVELSDVSKKKIKSLSGGMKQRLCLAQALLGSPSLLILDEPTAGLDPGQKVKFKNLISTLSSNKTIIISTHNVFDIEDIASIVIVLKKGKIIAADTPEKIMNQINNKVWLKNSLPNMSLELQNQFNVVNITRDGDNCRLRIVSDIKPSEDATPVKPTLEDYYMYVFGGNPS